MSLGMVDSEVKRDQGSEEGVKQQLNQLGAEKFAEAEDDVKKGILNELDERIREVRKKQNKNNTVLSFSQVLQVHLRLRG